MNILNIVNKFLPEKDFKSFKCFGNGHINATYLVLTTDNEYYVVQKINTNIFKDVEQLMNNIHQVTKHLFSKNVESIHMIKTVDGLRYVQAGDDFYRCYKFLENTMVYEKVDSLKMVELSAAAFGRFHNDLADLDPNLLVESIPHFHDTPHRYKDFLEAVKNDKCGRAKDCQTEIETIKKYADYYTLITDGIEKGEVKLHITHNDPKINNALFDSKTKQFRSIIDLDTVMPGSVLYDFGDAVRSLFTGDKEDTKNYLEVVASFPIYRAYLSAYYGEAKNFLTEREKELFPYAPFVITMELAMRFLGDHLNGDVYFGAEREGHNLDRARTQINLGVSIINNIEALKHITKEIIEK